VDTPANRTNFVFLFAADRDEIDEALKLDRIECCHDVFLLPKRIKELLIGLQFYTIND
jgi:hypothetical protein